MDDVFCTIAPTLRMVVFCIRTVLTYSNRDALAVHDPYVTAPETTSCKQCEYKREAEATSCYTKKDTSKTFCHNFGSISQIFGLASVVFARFFLCQLLLWQILFSQVFALPTFGWCQKAPQPITEVGNSRAAVTAAKS